MKYRFEKDEKELTPQEVRKKYLIAFGIVLAIVLVILILFSAKWWKTNQFKKRVAQLIKLVESGKLDEATNYVRYRERQSAVAAARWADTTGNEHVIEEMRLLRYEHSPDWTEWTTDLKFNLNVEMGYDRYFIRARWIKEEGEWVIDLSETYEYQPIDDTTRGRVLDILSTMSSLDLENYLQSETPPGEWE